MDTAVIVVASAVIRGYFPVDSRCVSGSRFFLRIVHVFLQLVGPALPGSSLSCPPRCLEPSVTSGEVRSLRRGIFAFASL